MQILKSDIGYKYIAIHTEDKCIHVCRSYDHIHSLERKGTEVRVGRGQGRRAL